jgi:phage portal protein BeeE
MGLRDTITKWAGGGARNAIIPAWPPGVDNLLPYANIAGQMYPLNLTMPGSHEEDIEADFESYTLRAFKSNSVVFSLMRDRVALFSQARFKYRNFQSGKLFGGPSLSILETPWPNGTTADLLARAIEDVDLAGNFYATKRGGRIVRMRPSWVTMVFGGPGDIDADDLDAEFLGIIYYPGGEWSGGTPEYLQRSEIAHFAPLPDPTAHARGMSWVTPIVREIMGDSAATSHKLKFFENGATPNLVVKREDAPTPEQFREWRNLLEEGHTGVANAYKTLYLTNGADATILGRDMQQMDFKALQAISETRMASAGGVHPVIAGFSEGLAGSSLNQGNFGAARRLMADKTLWWLWANFAGSMQTLVKPPQGSQLWIDASDIPFLREDRKDAAEIQEIKARTIGQLIRDGFEAESAKSAVNGEDMSLLKHSGLVSVQLQPPGTEPPGKPSSNGKPVANGKPAATGDSPA